MNFQQTAINAGYCTSLIFDFLDDIEKNPRYSAWRGKPTLERLAEYNGDRDSEYASQVNWDARQRRPVVNPGGYQRGLQGV